MHYLECVYKCVFVCLHVCMWLYMYVNMCFTSSVVVKNLGLGARPSGF